jgi:hypothetical protein
MTVCVRQDCVCCAEFARHRSDLEQLKIVWWSNDGFWCLLVEVDAPLGTSDRSFRCENNYPLALRVALFDQKPNIVEMMAAWIRLHD